MYCESLTDFGCSGQGDGRIRVRLRRKAATTSRVVAAAEGEAAQWQRTQLEARVVHCSGRQGGLGCGCVAATRATARAASGGGDLRGCVKEQRVMAAGAASCCSSRGEKEAEEAMAAVEVS
ncbi:hypothetical protein BHE74_00048343 [Ensete ventricosum]|nr:hypothetical protein BHE74_00048343 [Ensete ventricosum]